MMSKDFSECSCECRSDGSASLFDKIVAEETKFGITLADLSHSNVGWFSDKSLNTPSLVEEWDILAKEGVYILWHKNDYCPTHELFHMKALYVGKGNIGIRLRDHWDKKDFSSKLLVYWTYVEMPNRRAKYVEQLLLDIYNLPFNKSENRGSQLLCAQMTQGEVD